MRHADISEQAPLTQHGREEDFRGGAGLPPLVQRKWFPRTGRAAQRHVSFQHWLPWDRALRNIRGHCRRKMRWIKTLILLDCTQRRVCSLNLTLHVQCQLSSVARVIRDDDLAEVTAGVWLLCVVDVQRHVSWGHGGGETNPTFELSASHVHRTLGVWDDLDGVEGKIWNLFTSVGEIQQCTASLSVSLT